VFDEIRQGVLTDRSQYYKDLSAPFYGANREGSTVSQGTRDEFWLWSMTVGIKGAYDCVRAFSETDTTEDLKKVDVPTLIVHGDDDQIVPIVSAGDKSSKIVKGAQYKIYEGAPHGFAMAPKYAEIFNKDLLEFARSQRRPAPRATAAFPPSGGTAGKQRCEAAARGSEPARVLDNYVRSG
jgi:non-heme chloroperoxidase